jgi:hypothetical protein
LKTIRKNFLLLVFAAGALFFIGNNVMADPTTPKQEPPGGGGGTIKYCLKGGLGMMGWAYSCLDPDSPTLPAYKCGSRYLISGTQYEQCW